MESLNYCEFCSLGMEPCNESSCFRRVLVLAALAIASPTLAQGVQTGSVRGVVTDATGQVVPQVAIRAESQRPAGCATHAHPTRRALFNSPGSRPVPTRSASSFHGLQPVASTVQVGVGSIERLDVVLQPAAVAESVTVTAADTVARHAPRAAGRASARPRSRSCRPAARRRSSPSWRPASPTTRRTSIRSPSRVRLRTTTCSCSTASTSTTTCSRAPTICSSRKPSKKRKC